MKWNLENLLIIIYESPYRIVKLLEDALNLFGECPVFIAREMTKEYETFYRGKLSGQLEFWQKNIPKGEFTLIFWPKGYSNDDNRNI
jgi:16S rRNA (cytidine1402-2'-O)-methyltransferase